MAVKPNIKLHKLRFRKLKKAPPGSAPGSFTISEDATIPVANVICYNDNDLQIHSVTTVKAITDLVQDNTSMNFWVEIKGYGDKNFYDELSTAFNIHRLVIEDIISGHQRPKVEESEENIFITSRVITYTEDDDVVDDQISLLIFKNIVFSIQEKQLDYFLPVKERLDHNRGIIRKSGVSYLGYALLDAVVDNYFPFLEKLGSFLDDLEDKLLFHPKNNLLQHIQTSKRRLILFRKIAWAEREKLNDILRTPSPLFSDVARRYLRDTYDHTIQVMDVTDSYREITASLMDIYLSSVSNRLNQVMKFLTIISTIFIPLTFIAGIYGMNFVYNDSVTGENYPLNMPELHSKYGYVITIGVMLVIVLLQINYFYRKGWLKVEDKNEP